MKKVTIQRSKWQRGGLVGLGNLFPSEYDTHLWGRKTESGCCLGHCLHQAHRVTYKSMRGIGDPGSLAEKNSKQNPLSRLSLDGWGNRYQNNDFAEKAVRINDDPLISDKMREYKLRRLFKSNGYQLEFID
jgi:hypothetical protein